MDKSALSPREIQHRLMCINRMHRSAADAKMKVTGIHRSQHMILMYLFRKNCKVSQKDIAEHFEISPAAVAVSLKKLEHGGYISRCSSKEDNRFNEIELTAKGKAVVEYSFNSFEEIDRNTLEGISEEEKEMLTVILDKIIGNLKIICGKDATK